MIFISRFTPSKKKIHQNWFFKFYCKIFNMLLKS